MDLVKVKVKEVVLREAAEMASWPPAVAGAGG